jgi:hypothetical protein
MAARVAGELANGLVVADSTEEASSSGSTRNRRSGRGRANGSIGITEW